MEKDIWREVTLRQSTTIARDIKSLLFVGKRLPAHTPGQFYIVKVTAPDGSVASREYSLSNTPNAKGEIEFGVQYIEQGIVSSYLHDATIGQKVLVKGPMGKYFNWDETFKGPIIFIAGGAGIVPFMSMVRLHPSNEITLMGSFRSEHHIPYYEELLSLQKKVPTFQMNISLTRNTPHNWTGEAGRINKDRLHGIISRRSNSGAHIYICGRTSFVEDMYALLQEIGVNDKQIQRERFG